MSENKYSDMEMTTGAGAGEAAGRKAAAGRPSGGSGKETGGRNRNIFSPLSNIRVLTSAGILSAIAIVLGFFKIPVTQLIEIRFAVLPVTIAAYLFGPVVGGAVGLVSDIGGYILRPTGPFFPGFTITSMVSGVIFGCFLYRQKPGISRILMSQIVYTIVCGILLNSIWLSILYGNGFVAVIGARFVKEMVMIPINTIMLATIIEPVKRYRRAAS